MVVTATYDNGLSEAVTDYTVSPETFDEAGEVTVTVTYQGKTDTFAVTVSEVELSSLEVTGTLDKLTYNAGDTFSESGLAVKATYSNGSVDEAFEGATFEFSKTGSGDWSETLSLDKGDTKVYVRAVSGDVTSAAKEFAVTVNVPAQSVTIEGESLTLYVGNGTTKNTAKLTATVDPSDTTDSVTWEIVSGNEFISLDGSTVTAIKAGEATIKVTAGSASDTITIIVKDNVLEYIEISAEPTDKEYTVGESLNTDGMVVTAFYTDGTNKTVTESCEVNVSELAEAGEVTVTVTYEGKTDTFAVNVYAAPVSIDANNIRAGAGVTIGSEAAENAMNGAIANGFKPGDILYFDFYSDGAGTADITFRLATCYLIGGTDWNNITEMGDMPLADLVTIKLNGSDVALDGMILEGGTSEEYPDIWHIIRDMVFEDMEIRDGLNTFEVEFLSHPEYEDKVPGFAGPGWGTTFCANVDDLVVNATSVGIRTLTGCAINSAPVVGTINSAVVPAESVDLVVEGDKLLLTFEVNGSVLDLSGLTGYDFEDPTTQDALSEYIERYLPQNMYFDIQNMANWDPTELDLTLTYENGKIIATVDVSGATIPDGNAFDTRYLTHIGGFVQNSNEFNFSPVGDSFTRASVTFNNLKYTLHYYAKSGLDAEYYGCVGFSVERIPVSMEAVSVTFNENTSTSVVVTYADGTTRKLAEGEYTVSDNNVTYSYNGGSLTATISEYTAAYDYTDNANNIKVAVKDNGGVPYLTLGVYFTLTSTAGEDTESARSVAANMVKDMVYTDSNIDEFDKFDLEANGSFSWIAWGNRVLSATASGNSLLEYKESGENVYGFEYSVDISSLDKSHYTLHFGADNGSGNPNDYNPGVSINEEYTVNGVTYQVVCYPDAPEDGTKFWAHIGLIIPSLIPEGNV